MMGFVRMLEDGQNTRIGCKSSANRQDPIEMVPARSPEQREKI